MEDTTIEDVLKTVEASYAQKDFHKALQILEEHKEEISSGLWHYNMGTVLGKMGELPRARYHLLMAEKEGFTTSEVLTNRNIVEDKLEIDRLEKPLTVKDFAVKGSLIGAEGLLTTFSILLIIVGIIATFKKSYKGLGLSLFFALGFLGFNLWVDSWNKFLVIEGQALKEGPSAIFPQKGEISPGVLVIAKQSGQWLEIIYPSRFNGWIKQSGLKELK